MSRFAISWCGCDSSTPWSFGGDLAWQVVVLVVVVVVVVVLVVVVVALVA